MKTNKLILVVFIALAACFSFSCKEKDEHVPPNLSFATGGIYTSADATVGNSATVTFGLIATKTEDDMKTLNISYTYDNGASVSEYTYTLTGAQQQNFTVDYPVTTRSVDGTEKWTFTLTDNDGNITSRSITLTVN